MRMRLTLLIAFLIVFSGCQIQQNVSTQNTEVESIDSTNRQGDSTLTGKVVQSGETFSLVDAKGKQTDLDSYKIDLAEYDGKQVSVTGQYSGDTLFVGTIDVTEE